MGGVQRVARWQNFPTFVAVRSGYLEVVAAFWAILDSDNILFWLLHLWNVEGCLCLCMNVFVVQFNYCVR